MIMASLNEFKQTAKILGIGEDGKVLIKIKDQKSLYNIKEIIIEPVDERKISIEQRNMIWSLIGDISEWRDGDRSSSVKTEVNNDLKQMFCEEYEIQEQFSLSDVSVKTALEYQKFLVEFILENDIPTRKPLQEMSGDSKSYIYSCLYNKRCCVCGLQSDLHHTDFNHSKVGMGRNRQEIIHEGLYVLPLCRKHHTEIHTMPENEFMEKYHIDGPIQMDKILCNRYGVKAFAE